MSQEAMFREDADELFWKAISDHKPLKVFCLFSGGNDSTVLAHYFRDRMDALVHVDTGTAVPGVREFVDEFHAGYIADEAGYPPLLVYEAGDAFDRMVLEPNQHGDCFGFPGPAQHHRAYQRIKERQVERLLRDHRAIRGQRFVLMTGVRRGESKRRMGLKEAINRKGGQVWINPLIDWTDFEMRAYRREHNLPESDPAALLHRSGECNCGAFAAPGEREELQSLYPDWWEKRIAPLEREAERYGLKACRWGDREQHKHEYGLPVGIFSPIEDEDDDEPAPRREDDKAPPMCSDCQLRMAT